MRTALIAAYLVVMFGSWLSGVWFGIVAVHNRKPGVPYFPGGLQSPFNVLGTPDRLTARGQWARKVCYASLGVFLACGAVAGVVGLWNKVVQWMN
jgi:hypothetical protein